MSTCHPQDWQRLPIRCESHRLTCRKTHLFINSRRMFWLMGLGCPVTFTHVCRLILLWLSEHNWGMRGRRELFWWGRFEKWYERTGQIDKVWQRRPGPGCRCSGWVTVFFRSHLFPRRRSSRAQLSAQAWGSETLPHYQRCRARGRPPMSSIGALSYADRIKKLSDTQTLHLSVVCLLFTSVSVKKSARSHCSAIKLHPSCVRNLVKGNYWIRGCTTVCFVLRFLPCSHSAGGRLFWKE